MFVPLLPRPHRRASGKPAVSATLLVGRARPALEQYAQTYLAGNNAPANRSRDEERAGAPRAQLRTRFASADGAMRYAAPPASKRGAASTGPLRAGRGRRLRALAPGARGDGSRASPSSAPPSTRSRANDKPSPSPSGCLRPGARPATSRAEARCCRPVHEPAPGRGQDPRDRPRLAHPHRGAGRRGTGRCETYYQGAAVNAGRQPSSILEPHAVARRLRGRPADGDAGRGVAGSKRYYQVESAAPTR